jgi:protein ImuB
MSSARRVACVALPEIHLEVAQSRARTTPSLFAVPLAVIVARHDGKVQTERDVLGGTKIDVVSAEARALGVRAGQTVASAKSRCVDLRIRVIAREAVRFTLARVAEAAGAFGPVVSFSDEEDVVWVEIGGCAHLQGGEKGLAEALHERIRGMGHVCRVAIANGPRIASAIARFGQLRRREAAPRSTFVVPEGKEAAAVRVLPIAALAFDDDTNAWLESLGLRFCGDLQKLPRRSFGMRLGPRARDVFPFLDGVDSAPLDAWRPPEVPEERVELEWAAEDLEALTFVMKIMCDRLAVRLHGRAMAAVRLEIALGFDRGWVERAEPAMPPLSTLDVTLPSPIARASDLFAVVKIRLEREAVLAPIVAVTLRAAELASAPVRGLDLFAPESKALRALPQLVAELTAELGEMNLGTLALGDSWVTHERTRLLPYGAGFSRSASRSSSRAPSRSPPCLTTAALEPTRLVPPFFVPMSELENVELLLRIEAVQWWRLGFQQRDFIAAWLPTGTDGALAWLEVYDHSSCSSRCSRGRGHEARLRGWID